MTVNTTAKDAFMLTKGDGWGADSWLSVNQRQQHLSIQF
jgi:hypothetical protein